MLGAIQLAQASTDSGRFRRAQKQSLSNGAMSKCGNMKVKAMTFVNAHDPLPLYLKAALIKGRFVYGKLQRDH